MFNRCTHFGYDCTLIGYRFQVIFDKIRGRAPEMRKQDLGPDVAYNEGDVGER